MQRNKPQPNLPVIMRDWLWQKMQSGQTEFIIEDTDKEFQSSALQVSKAIRRFNETGHALKWPGFRFSVKVLDVYRVYIRAEQQVMEWQHG